ncbi:MAG: hypothetical protein M1827_000712 [Pycnora praestabilis]|nr:MAG: hypothetical protein M1827_000712 [Pycnora praestabilis]
MDLIVDGILRESKSYRPGRDLRCRPKQHFELVCFRDGKDPFDLGTMRVGALAPDPGDLNTGDSPGAVGSIELRLYKAEGNSTHMSELRAISDFSHWRHLPPELRNSGEIPPTNDIQFLRIEKITKGARSNKSAKMRQARPGRSHWASFNLLYRTEDVLRTNGILILPTEPCYTVRFTRQLKAPIALMLPNATNNANINDDSIGGEDEPTQEHQEYQGNEGAENDEETPSRANIDLNQIPFKVKTEADAQTVEATGVPLGTSASLFVTPEPEPELDPEPKLGPESELPPNLTTQILKRKTSATSTHDTTNDMSFPSTSDTPKRRRADPETMKARIEQTRKKLEESSRRKEEEEKLAEEAEKRNEELYQSMIMEQEDLERRLEENKRTIEQIVKERREM